MPPPRQEQAYESSSDDRRPLLECHFATSSRLPGAGRSHGTDPDRARSPIRNGRELRGLEGYAQIDAKAAILFEHTQHVGTVILRICDVLAIGQIFDIARKPCLGRPKRDIASEILALASQ